MIINITLKRVTIKKFKSKRIVCNKIEVGDTYHPRKLSKTCLHKGHDILMKEHREAY